MRNALFRPAPIARHAGSSPACSLHRTA